MTVTDALFTFEAPCGDCGRPQRPGLACAWCAGRNHREAKKAGTRAAKLDPEWQQRAVEYRRGLGIGATFTADDLIEAIGLPTGSSNQVGAIVHTWATRGFIEAAGFTQSTRKSNHGRWVRQWQVAV